MIFIRSSDYIHLINEEKSQFFLETTINNTGFFYFLITQFGIIQLETTRMLIIRKSGIFPSQFK